MSHYQYDEKPKNEFQYEKPKNERERGGCLTAFLAVFIGLNMLSFLVVCSQMSSPRLSRYATGPVFLVALVVECIVVACAVGIWNWQKWGYYGLAAIYGLSVVVTLCSGNILSAIGSGVVLAILVSLVNAKIELFD